MLSKKKSLIDGSAIEDGDVVLGIASNGLHSNGFSLIRRIVFGDGDAASNGLETDTFVNELNATVGETLLRPTRIYTGVVRHVLTHYKVKNVVHGIAHITGGGLEENISRILPANHTVSIKEGSWDVPPVFAWLQQLADVDNDEMDRVFNMGIGLALVVSPFYANKIAELVNDFGYDCWAIGQVNRS